MAKPTSYTAKPPDARGYIAYDAAEDAVWADLVARQMPAAQAHMARPWLEGLARLDLPADRVPQCPEVSARLAPITGWRVEPVPALIGFAHFFAMLADRAFPAASFIRRREHFHYLEEPDIFHEIFGHAPLLADPAFAGFGHAIGQAGARAEKQDYAWLIRLYWFTIEFGLIRQDGGLKALGSGLASSVTELPWSLSDGRESGPEHRPFDIIDILRTPYRIDIHQPVYFVLDRAEDLFAAADRDLLADVAEARRLGLHAPKYPPKEAA